MLLALVVLWGLRPWEDDSAAPRPVPLGIEAAIGGGKALTAPAVASVAKGVVVATSPRPPASAQAQVVRPGGGGANSGSGPALAVAEGEAVLAPANSVTPGPGAPAATPAPAAPEAQPVSAPAAGTIAAPPPAPVVATTADGQGSGPVPAGVGGREESCEGDEYLLTITFLDEGSTAEAPVDIVLARLNEGEATDALQLEGDLGDARALASALSSEGNCVQIEIAPLGEGEEGAEGGPGTGEEAPEPVEEIAELEAPPIQPSP